MKNSYVIRNLIVGKSFTRKARLKYLNVIESINLLNIFKKKYN